MNYRTAFDGEWPTDLTSLAPYCFSWPFSGPTNAPYFQLQLEGVSQGGLHGSWLVVGPNNTTIETVSWSCLISENMLRTGMLRQPFTLSGNLFSRNELGLWSALRSQGPWLALGEDARRLFAGRELEMLAQRAAVQGNKLFATMAEIQYWSGHDLLNLVPVDPAAAHVQLLTNGTDAYRVIVSYAGGFTEDTVCEALLLGSGRGSWRALPFVEFDRTQSTAWQPIGAWQLEPAASAQLGPQGFPLA